MRAWFLLTVFTVGVGCSNDDLEEPPPEEGPKPEGAGAADLGSTSGGEPVLSDPACFPGSSLRFDVGQSHRIASAAYAVDAVATRTWPTKADMSELRLGDFVAAFPDPARPPKVHAGFVADEPGGTIGTLFVFPEQDQPEDKLVELFVVVDVTASMRNELPLAGGVVRELARGLEQQESAAVAFGVVALGANSERFATLEEGTPTEVAERFEAFVNDASGGAPALKDGQLGPFVGLDAIDEKAPAAATFLGRLLEAEEPRVLVVTDGGFAADEGTVRTIDAWVSAGAQVSFAQLHAVTDAEAGPTQLRGELLQALAERGGGGAFYLSTAAIEANAPTPFSAVSLARRLMGPMTDPSSATTDGARQIAATTATDVLPDTGGPYAEPPRTWRPVDAAVAAMRVETCGSPPPIEVDGHAIPSEPSDHLSLLVGIVGALQSGCDAKAELDALEAESGKAGPEVQALLIAMKGALDTCP